ncbi:transcriptional regulator [Streptomyces lonarensis]|uniref:Helix-turn-helix domain-containing protein n=1 Tax=Streptomyces lonarensis TaxID=700599 RepID=A0A7X6HXV1_9ACTN|nr:helix-turn-helix transcriptional regulator [Streptomyces lonarensis]NJQ04514.1 helix-turn-helix domain-containing protein [Streptomyces lonarensis]
MPEVPETPEHARRLAELLTDVKERSGLSYGALAERLHSSTSSLHRYCRGAAVPQEYAPIERFIRVCRGTREEVEEGHRRWILADEERRRESRRAASTPRPASGVPPAAPPGGADREAHGPPSAGVTSVKPAESADGSSRATGGELPGGTDRSAGVGPAVPPTPQAPSGPERDAPSRGPGEAAVLADRGAPCPADRSPARVRRIPLLVTAAALVASALAAFLWSGTAERTEGIAGATADAPPPERGDGHPDGALGEDPASGADRGAADVPVPGQGEGQGEGQAASAPLTVLVKPHDYEGPCDQHLLVDLPPEQVAPAPPFPGAAPWIEDHGAVPAFAQRVGITVQGTGPQAVILESVDVRVTRRGAPLGWNEYALNLYGCGGALHPRPFSVDLDSDRPVVEPGADQPGFPFTVDQSDPEILHINARTTDHDVSWDLTLRWTSQGRTGTTRIDNDGSPFRTSAGVGAWRYAYTSHTAWEPHPRTD